MTRIKALKRNSLITLVCVVAVLVIFIWSERKSFKDGSGVAVSSDSELKNDRLSRPVQVAVSRISKPSYKAAETSSSTLQSATPPTEKKSQENSGDNPNVVDYLKTQNYSDMNPSEINELLGLVTLGEGIEFEKSRANHVTTLADFGRSNPSGLKFMELLQGKYRSDFVDVIPKADEQGYVIELDFLKDRLNLSISLNSKVYYEHAFMGLKNSLMIGKAPQLPPNLFIEIPAKPQYGYLHPLYLELLIGEDRQTFIGVLYNTNQNLSSSVNYLHSENLIFKKID